MEARTVISLLEIAHKLHAKHKEHLQVDISIAQRTDDLGIGLQIVPAAVLPDGVLAFGRLSGFWLGTLSAVDKTLFRDESGDFATAAPSRVNARPSISPSAPLTTGVRASILSP